MAQTQSVVTGGQTVVTISTAKFGGSYTLTFPETAEVKGLRNLAQGIVSTLNPELITIIKSHITTLRGRIIWTLLMVEQGQTHEINSLLHDFSDTLVPNWEFCRPVWDNPAYRGEPLVNPKIHPDETNPRKLLTYTHKLSKIKYSDPKYYEKIEALNVAHPQAIRDYRRESIFQTVSHKQGKDRPTKFVKDTLNLKPGRWTTYKEYIDQATKAGDAKLVSRLKDMREEQEACALQDKGSNVLKVLASMLRDTNYFEVTCRGCGSPDGQRPLLSNEVRDRIRDMEAKGVHFDKTPFCEACLQPGVHS